MSFFNSGLFWFLEGILACLTIIGFRVWTQDRKIPMNPWKWAAFIAWLGLFAFTLSFVFTSLGEKESHAAQMGGIIFGLLTLIAAVGVWRLLLFKGKGSAGPAGDAAAGD